MNKKVTLDPNKIEYDGWGFKAVGLTEDVLDNKRKEIHNNLNNKDTYEEKSDNIPTTNT